MKVIRLDCGASRLIGFRESSGDGWLSLPALGNSFSFTDVIIPFLAMAVYNVPNSADGIMRDEL